MTLGQLLSGKIHFGVPQLIQLLGLKLFLSSTSLALGLVGGTKVHCPSYLSFYLSWNIIIKNIFFYSSGVFAPSLFFGAVAGTIYHDVIVTNVDFIRDSITHIGLSAESTAQLLSYVNIANAPGKVGPTCFNSL